MVKVVFLLTGNECRNGPVHGDTLRGNIGMSGTDQTTILVSEYLASQGIQVTIAAPNGATPGTTIRGVVYTNMKFDGIQDPTFDVFVNTLWFQDFDSLPIKVTKAVVSWIHVPYVFGVDELKEWTTRDGLKYGVVHLSEWCKKLNTETAKHVTHDVIQHVIPNPIATEIAREVDDEGISRVQRDCVFHGAWSRGGHVALRVMKELGWHDSKMHVCDYLMGRPNDPMIQSFGSVGKRDVFRQISKADYFIYPLAREDGETHKDTFACVVAEAMAMGAIVLTYPVAALPETYQDTCFWLPFPQGIQDMDHMLHAPLSKDPVMVECNHIVESLRFLEANPSLKQMMREKAKAFVLSKYNPEEVGKKWVALIQELIA